MLVPFSEVCALLRLGYFVHTRQEIVALFDKDLKESFAIAGNIEDYEYLSVMTNENTNYDNFVVVYSTYKATLPITLEKDKSLTLFEFACLFCDTDRRIDKTEFYLTLEKEAQFIGQDPQSILLQFDIYVDKILDEREKTQRKIGRNESCPCGSGKKFKYCHGAN